jgi:hypothetical protein
MLRKSRGEKRALSLVRVKIRIASVIEHKYEFQLPVEGVWKQCAERNIWTLEEVEGGWIRSHNEELHNLCASPNIIRVIKSRRVRSVRQVARIGDEKYIQNSDRKT